MRVLWQNQNNDRRVTPVTLDSEFSILYSHVHLQKEREKVMGVIRKKKANLFKKVKICSRKNTCNPALPSLNHTGEMGEDQTSYSPFKTL